MAQESLIDCMSSTRSYNNSHLIIKTSMNSLNYIVHLSSHIPDLTQDMLYSFKLIVTQPNINASINRLEY